MADTIYKPVIMVQLKYKKNSEEKHITETEDLNNIRSCYRVFFFISFARNFYKIYRNKPVVWADCYFAIN